MRGKIELITGLHIGGSENDIRIGGVDNGVIKTIDGKPYIPGSSLKGKLRYLLEMAEGRDKVCECGKVDCSICKLFGVGANKKSEKIGPTRLKVRDSYLSSSNDEGTTNYYDFEYEVKMENTIKRLNSKAMPRQIERVPAGTVFDFNMVVDLFDTKNDFNAFKELIFTMCLLEEDYLGGNGSRGYGQIEFKDMKIDYLSLEKLKKGEPKGEKTVEENRIKDILDDLENIKNKLGIEDER